ncbi:MAG: preprotein translocase subunit SecG [Angelakisella sp.]
MGTIEMIGAVVMIIASLLIVGLVTIQDAKGDGISALGGGNSFLNNNNDRSMDAKLNKITKVLTIVFFVLTIVVYAFAK